MLIKRLRLHHIRSYTDEVIEFPEGSLLLSGDIGSGKSTILLAIEFALFGADTGRLSGNALLRKGADEGDVELTFGLNGGVLTIKRGLKRSRGVVAQTSGWIIRDGKKKEAMPIELKSDIITLLGYPEELVTKKKNLVYCYSVYCPQEEMKAILSDEQESRLDTLRKIFGVDKYKRVRENCAVVTRELKTRQRLMEARIGNLDELKRQQEEKKDKQMQLSDEAGRVVQLVEKVRVTVGGIKERRKAWEQKVAVLHEKRKAAEVASTQKALKQDILQKNTVKIEQLRQVVERYASLGDEHVLETALGNREEELRRKMTEHTLLKQQFAQLSQRVTELRKEVEGDVEQDVFAKKAKIQELSQKLLQKEPVRQKKEELERALELHRAALKEYDVKKAQAEDVRHKILTIATCPVCLQTVSKEHKERVCDEQQKSITLFGKRFDEYKELIAVKEKELLDQRKLLDALNETERLFFVLTNELRHLEARQKERDEKKKMLEESRRKQETLTQELKKYLEFDSAKEQEEIRTLKGTLEKARERERARTMADELAEAQEQIAQELRSVEAMIQTIQKEINELEPSEEELRKVQEELESAVSEERSLSIQHAQLITEKREIEKNIAQLEKEIAQKEEVKKSIHSMGQLLHWLDEYFIQLMVTIEKQVMLRIYHEFNDTFRAWFAVLIADEGMNARIDDSFNPIVEQNGYEIDSAYLSGGERTSVALSYRLALNKVVNDIIHTIKTKELLILDEPTEGFSTEQLDRVRDVLRQLQVKQVILVSHENKIESFVDTVVRVVKEDGVSKVMHI